MIERVLVSVGPELFFRTAHHQKMCYDLVSRAHYPSPRVAIIADRVQAKSAQQVGARFRLVQRDRRLAFAEQVGHLDAKTQPRALRGGWPVSNRIASTNPDI